MKTGRDAPSSMTRNICVRYFLGDSDSLGLRCSQHSTFSKVLSKVFYTWVTRFGSRETKAGAWSHGVMGHYWSHPIRLTLCSSHAGPQSVSPLWPLLLFRQFWFSVPNGLIGYSRFSVPIILLIHCSSSHSLRRGINLVSGVWCGIRWQTLHSSNIHAFLIFLKHLPATPTCTMSLVLSKGLRVSSRDRWFLGWGHEELVWLYILLLLCRGNLGSHILRCHCHSIEGACVAESRMKGSPCQSPSVSMWAVNKLFASWATETSGWIYYYSVARTK